MKSKGLTYLLIAAMGFVGATLRYCIECLLSEPAFPFATLGINLVGCFAIAFVNDFIGRRLHLNADVVRAMGVGLIGSFSTLSAFCTESLELLEQGSTVAFFVYLFGTFIGCFLAAYAGSSASCALAARRLARRRAQIKRQRDVQREDAPQGGVRHEDVQRGGSRCGDTRRQGVQRTEAPTGDASRNDARQEGVQQDAACSNDTRRGDA